jgi:hypothetical protein
MNGIETKTNNKILQKIKDVFYLKKIVIGFGLKFVHF